MKKVQELKNFIIDQGVSDIGFAYVDGHVPNNWNKLKYAISIVIHLSEQIIDDIVDKPTQTYFSHYRSINYHINQITLRTMMYLQDLGYKAVTVPASQSINSHQKYTGVFQHKTAATLSGMGWIGKSALFIHNKYGPRVRLGTVITNMELPFGNPITESRCGDCKKCVISCPAMAIEGVEWIQGKERNLMYDPSACSAYMKKNFQHIGRGSVCGICISSCPIKVELD